MMILEQLENDIGQLSGEEWGNGIADLVVLLRLVPLKEVIVGKRLKSRRLADGQRSTLRRIVMNEVVTILGDVAGHSRGRSICQLHLESVGKSLIAFRTGFENIAMSRKQRLWKISQHR